MKPGVSHSALLPCCRAWLLSDRSILHARSLSKLQCHIMVAGQETASSWC